MDKKELMNSESSKFIPDLENLAKTLQEKSQKICSPVMKKKLAAYIHDTMHIFVASAISTVNDLIENKTGHYPTPEWESCELDDAIHGKIECRMAVLNLYVEDEDTRHSCTYAIDVFVRNDNSKLTKISLYECRNGCRSEIMFSISGIDELRMYKDADTVIELLSSSQSSESYSTDDLITITRNQVRNRKYSDIVVNIVRYFINKHLCEAQENIKSKIEDVQNAIATIEGLKSENE